MDEIAARVRDVSARFARIAHEALGMDMAYVAEATGTEQLLRAVAGAVEPFGNAVGTTAPWEGTYCARMVDRRIAHVIPDARQHPVTSALPITEAVGIGAYVGVPVRLADGRLYGTLCCLSRGARRELGDAEARTLQALADALARELVPLVGTLASAATRRDEIARAARGEGLRVVFQPVVRLATGEVTSVEALARFDVPPARPDQWFADAATLGLGAALELAAVRHALVALDRLPAPTRLAVNASPSVAASAAMRALLLAASPERVVVEITEHSAVAEYPTLLAALAPLRAAGVRLAIDDAGAGYASFRHVLKLLPDVIKLDRDLVRGLPRDPAREALVGALLAFADGIGAEVVAEGIETQQELDLLVRLGVAYGQGYFLARPGPLPIATITAAPTPGARHTSAAAPHALPHALPSRVPASEMPGSPAQLRQEIRMAEAGLRAQQDALLRARAALRAVSWTREERSDGNRSSTSGG